MFLLPNSNTLSSWICLASSSRRKCSIFCDNYVTLFWQTNFFEPESPFSINFIELHLKSGGSRWPQLQVHASKLCLHSNQPASHLGQQKGLFLHANYGKRSKTVWRIFSAKRFPPKICSKFFSQRLFH